MNTKYKVYKVYKLVKFTDGLGYSWYQIKIPGILFGYRWYKIGHNSEYYGLTSYSPRFKTEQEAHDYIKKEMYHNICYNLSQTITSSESNIYEI
jgi:hypothetical protein